MVWDILFEVLHNKSVLSKNKSDSNIDISQL